MCMVWRRPRSAEALLTAATGRPLDSAVFKDHLRQRYLA